jgi:hypothetical protein
MFRPSLPTIANGQSDQAPLVLLRASSVLVLVLALNAYPGTELQTSTRLTTHLFGQVGNLVI